MTAVRVGSLCTGYGGIELGLALAGVNVDLRWLAEVDPALSPLHGATPNLGNIAQVDWSGVDGVNLLTAGFPCQPTSAAGRKLGAADPRWLWPDIRAAVAELQPTHVLIENVRNLVSYDKGRLWAGILADFEGLGYGVRWLTLGACHVGAAHHRHRVFALAETGGRGAERIATTFCGAKGQPILPTPGAADATGGRRVSASTLNGNSWIVRPSGQSYGVPLASAVQLLPTPSASDAVMGPSTTRSGKRHGEVNGLTGIATLARSALLPMPRAGDAELGASYHNNRGEPSAVQPEHWGRFAEAVARHESLYGPAPAPTEPNRNGAPRLAPAFAEWLMCLPAGHVTAKLDRRDALRAIGNGVCPPQLAAAWRLLTGGAL